MIQGGKGMPATLSTENKGKDLVIKLVLPDFKASSPEKVLELSAKIRELIGQDITTGYLSDLIKNFANSLSSTVCKVCMGTGQVGGEEKVECPVCHGQKWRKLEEK